MMRSILALAFTAALANTATEADMPVKAPPAPAPAPVYMWTGCYIGGNIGWAQVSAHLDDQFYGDDGRLSSSGIAGGGQIGCDYQFASNWVFGVQGMFDGTDISRSRVGIVNSDLTFHSAVHSFATITARLGYLVTPSFLFYAKGGWGTVNQHFSVTEIDGDMLTSVHRNSSGGDVGVGFEYMFAPSWTLFVEWDHIFLDHTSIDFDVSTDNIRRDFDKVLFGINWRFGGARSPY
jgi:outer membrane immunogenic protein